MTEFHYESDWRLNLTTGQIVNADNLPVGNGTVLRILEQQAREIERLKELSKTARSRACTWRYDGTHDKWDAACGEAWYFIEGGPRENRVRFCPFCGGMVNDE